MATTTATPNPAPAKETSLALTPLQRKFATMKTLLDTNNVRSQIEAALPQAMQAPRFLRIALTELRGNPMLLQCTPESVIGSVIQAAQLGLELDHVLGQGYLIPYKNTHTDPASWECQFQPGYRGYVQLSRRTGEIKSLGAHVVHAGEYFDYQQGTDPFLKHRPDMECEDQPITHVYAIVHYTNGGFDFEVMSHSGVERVRAKSKAPSSPAWKDHWDEMAKAKVIRRLAKRLPVSAENSAIVKAAVLDEMADAGIPQQNENVIEGNEQGQPYVPNANQAVGHDSGMAKKAKDNLAGIKQQHAQPEQNSEGVSGHPTVPRTSEVPPTVESSGVNSNIEQSTPEGQPDDDGLRLEWEQ